MELEKLEVDYQLFEMSGHFGGLCDSWQDAEGYWHDYGPHIFHNAEGFEWFLDLLPNAKRLPRNDDIMLADKTVVSYPVQTSCAVCPNRAIEIRNYGDYCRHHYGGELCSQFFFPWNEKVYATHITNIDLSVVSRAPSSGQPAGNYLYPASGRFAELPEVMATRLPEYRLHALSPVTYVDFGKQYLLGDIKCHYQVLVWAAPFRDLVTYLHLEPRFLTYADLYLITRRVDAGCLPGLARYHADAKTLEHRQSYEAVLKGNKNQFVQSEINASRPLNRTALDLKKDDTAFILPNAYINPTVAWIGELTQIVQDLRQKNIILHGKAGTTIHKNIWPIIQDSRQLAKEIIRCYS
jgi:hypothetical protein